jgi:hypothetical protein
MSYPVVLMGLWARESDKQGILKQVYFCHRYFLGPILFPLFDTVSEYRKWKFVIRYTIFRYFYSPIFRYFFLYPISIEYRIIDTCIGSAQLCYFVA